MRWLHPYQLHGSIYMVCVELPRGLGVCELTDLGIHENSHSARVQLVEF